MANPTIQINENLTLSRLVAGCMRMVDDGLAGDDMLRFVEECIARGIDTFDHAPVYGGYTVEQLFGDAVLRKNPALRKKMKLVTKTGIVLPNTYGSQSIHYTSSPDWVRGEVERSLQKLGTDTIDLLLVHRPDYLMDPAETGAVLDELVQSGKVLAVGVSNFTPTGLATLQHFMKNKLVTNQVQISAKTPDVLFDGTMDDALVRGIPLMAWSPLGGGSIFVGEDAQSARLREVVGGIAKERGVGIDTILYAWVLRLPTPVLPLVGATTMDRVDAALAALDITLTHDEWYRILAASRGFDVP